MNEPFFKRAYVQQILKQKRVLNQAMSLKIVLNSTRKTLTPRLQHLCYGFNTHTKGFITRAKGFNNHAKGINTRVTALNFVSRAHDKG